MPMKSIWTSFQIFSDTALQMSRAHVRNADLTSLKQEWAQKILSRVGVDLRIIGTPSTEKSVLFVGNHMSYLDIPLLMWAVPEISFVAKREIRNWPLFGYGATLMQTVFVDRNDQADRFKARRTIAQELESGKRIAVFPSGTTCTEERRDWRRGPFEIAKTHAASIQPFRLSYSPARLAAYVDDDIFPLHLIQLIQHSPVQATIEFHPPVEVTNPEESRLNWQSWVRNGRDTTEQSLAIAEVSSTQ